MFSNAVRLVVTGLFICLTGISSLRAADEMRVKDLPMPEGAAEISFMKRRGDVRFQIDSDFKTTGQFYSARLLEQKWTKSGKDNLQRNFWVQKFSKGNVSLEVRVDSRPGGSEVRLTPTGMMWEEDDQPRPKDLPLTADATEVEYDDFFESIEFKSQSDVKTVVAFLTGELEKRKWTRAAVEVDLESFVRMKFTLQKSSLDIDVRAEDAGSEVSIRTKGMQWDGMEEEIERAKKMAEETAASKPETSKPEKESQDDKPASLPPRKEKPGQGIDAMPKLDNAATVVMDGKTFSLPVIVAYEVFENDQWSTKIVATQKPIKQQTLLEKLRKSGTDRDDEDQPMNYPPPYLMIELDEDDRPTRLSLQADGTPGSHSGSDLDGTALVENGRARGTVRMKEPDSFFEKVYTAEISFDLPVLTRESTAAKRLTDVPKLANSGKLTIGGKTYRLEHVVSYESKRFDNPVTTIVVSEKPLNMAKLNSALGKEAADDYFEFVPQVKLTVDADENLDSVSIWADNASIGGNSDLASDIVIEDGRVRGVARMTKPGEFFEKEYNFEVSVDVNILGKKASVTSPPSGGLAADSYNGLPVPEGYNGIQSEGSQFRKQTTTTVTAELNAVVDFYRRELAGGEWGEWKEDASAAVVEKQTAKLAFSGPTGSLMVQLKADGPQAGITIVSRDSQAAKEAGLLPSKGKARLVIGNASDKASTITVNKREYKVAAGLGADDPKTGLNWEVAPGNYTVEVRLPGGKTQSEKIKIAPDETWGVIVGESGEYFAAQLY